MIKLFESTSSYLPRPHGGFIIVLVSTHMGAQKGFCSRGYVTHIVIEYSFVHFTNILGYLI